MPDTEPNDDLQPPSKSRDLDWDRGLFEFLFSRKRTAADRREEERSRSYRVNPASWFSDRTRPSGA